MFFAKVENNLFGIMNEFLLLCKSYVGILVFFAKVATFFFWNHEIIPGNHEIISVFSLLTQLANSVSGFANC